MKKTVISGTPEILKYNDYKAFAYLVKAEGVEADSEGRKIVKAGTPLPGNDDTAKGILLSDVDVTDGDAPGALVYEGSLDSTKITANGITIAAAVKTALPRVTFF
ncbi:MAG: hypothetical protein IJ740_06055 [Ruminococcus sp.]|nr:hypothetical protein [Ruminococcus sp.]